MLFGFRFSVTVPMHSLHDSGFVSAIRRAAGAQQQPGEQEWEVEENSASKDYMVARLRKDRAEEYSSRTCDQDMLDKKTEIA